MKIAICDDDEMMQKEVKRFINEYSEKHKLDLPEIQLFSCGEDLIACEDRFDIAFLDVEMSGISGIYTGKELEKKNKKILNFIITSHTDYLDEAMSFHAFRFLSKPLDKQRFFRNYKDALRAYHTVTERTAIETKEGIFAVDSSDIIMIEAQFRKVIVTTVDGTYYSTQRIDYWANSLNKMNFFRTHRSFIVNMEHVDNFTHNLVTLHEGKYTAYLTVRKYPDFKRCYMMYLECMR